MSYKQLAQWLERHPEFEEVTSGADVVVDLKYAGLDNFLGTEIYKDFERAYLHRMAFDKFNEAVHLLNRKLPGWQLKVFDCTRPPGAQQFMWNRLQGTPEQPYLADPAVGSIHSYGFAMDVTLLDDQGKELDMGTAFDAFTPMSEPRKEQAFLRQGRLTQTQMDNRRLLRSIMHAAGFTVLPIEWWHFDALPPDEVRARYKPVK